jgi:hypothetical protein
MEEKYYNGGRNKQKNPEDDHKGVQYRICHYSSICLNKDAKDREKDGCYDYIREISRNIISEQELIIIGDLSAKVISKTNYRRVGQYGESEQNDNGDRIVRIVQQRGSGSSEHLF